MLSDRDIDTFDWIENASKGWLGTSSTTPTFNVRTELDSVKNNSPYSGITAYNPNTILDANQALVTALWSHGSSYNPSGSAAAIMDVAQSEGAAVHSENDGTETYTDPDSLIETFRGRITAIDPDGDTLGDADEAATTVAGIANPVTDIADLETDQSGLRTKVGLLNAVTNPAGDADYGQAEAVTIGTMNPSAVDMANAKVAASALSSFASVLNGGGTDIGTLTTAGLGYVQGIANPTVSTSTSEGYHTQFKNAVDQIGASPATAITGYAASAVSLFSSIGNPTTDLSDAQTRLDAFTAIVDALSPIDDIETYVDTVVGKITTIANPSTDLTDAIARFADYQTYMTTLAPVTSITTAHAAAITAIDATLFDSDRIDAVVDAFEDRSQGAFQRGVARVAAGMFDLRAVMSSQFGMALALMERDRAQEVNDFDAKLRMQIEQQRADHAIQILDRMTRLMELEASVEKDSVQLQFAIDKLSNELARQDADRNANLAVSLSAQLANLEQLRLSVSKGVMDGQTELDRLSNELDRADAARKASLAADLIGKMSSLKEIQIHGQQAMAALQLEIDRLKNQLTRQDADRKTDGTARIVQQMIEWQKLRFAAKESTTDRYLSIEGNTYQIVNAAAKIKGEIALDYMDRYGKAREFQISANEAVTRSELEIRRLAEQLAREDAGRDIGAVLGLTEQIGRLQAIKMQADQGSMGLELELARLKNEKDEGIVDRKTKCIMQLAHQLFGQLPVKGQIMGAAVQAQLETNRMKLATKQDEIQFNLASSVKDTLWNLDLFQYGTQGISTMSGIPSVIQQAPIDRFYQATGQIMGAVSGLASMGTGMAGSMLPLLGML